MRERNKETERYKQRGWGWNEASGVRLKSWANLEFCSQQCVCTLGCTLLFPVHRTKQVLVVVGTWGSMRRSLDADCKVSISFSFLINKIKKETWMAWSCLDPRAWGYPRPGLIPSFISEIPNTAVSCLFYSKLIIFMCVLIYFILTVLFIFIYLCLSTPMSLASLKVPTLFLCYREIFTYLFLVPRLVWVLGYHTRINLFVGCVREMSIRNTGFSTVEHILNAGVIFQQLLWGGVGSWSSIF